MDHMTTSIQKQAFILLLNCYVYREHGEVETHFGEINRRSVFFLNGTDDDPVPFRSVFAAFLSVGSQEMLCHIRWNMTLINHKLHLRLQAISCQYSHPWRSPRFCRNELGSDYLPLYPHFTPRLVLRSSFRINLTGQRSSSRRVFCCVSSDPNMWPLHCLSSGITEVTWLTGIIICISVQQKTFHWHVILTPAAFSFCSCNRITTRLWTRSLTCQKSRADFWSW